MSETLPLNVVSIYFCGAPVCILWLDGQISQKSISLRILEGTVSLGHQVEDLQIYNNS